MSHPTVYRSPAVIAGVALALFIAMTGIFAPMLAPYDPHAVTLSSILCPPVSCESDGRSHVLGTDHLGRDVLSRIVTSFRIHLYIGILGTLSGLLAAWMLVIARSIRGAAPTPDMLRPLSDVPLYGLAAIAYVIAVLLSLVFVAFVGASLMFVVVCVGVFSSVLPMALVYESVRGDHASSNPVRLAARRGIALSPVCFSLTLLMGLLIESTLSFLGLGVPPPDPSLGDMIAGVTVYLPTGLWMLIFPLGIVLAAAVAFAAIVIQAGRDLTPARGARVPSTLLAEAGTPAGFWIKLAAWLIDYAVLLVLVIILASITGQQPGIAEVISVIAFLMAYVWISVASLGKHVIGLHVLRPDGSSTGLGRRFCRCILSSLMFGIGHLVIAFRQDKRGLHDLICDTVVVRR